MSRHHQAAKWANHAKAARQRVGATLPAPCVHCGRIVTADMPWDVGHVVDLALGGDARTYGPAHRGPCNRRAGGKLGAAMRRRPKSSRGKQTREAAW